MAVTAGNSFLPEGEQKEPRRLSGIRWRWGVIAAIGMSLLSLWPQLDMVRHRGSEWNGAFAHSNYDEEAYAAYLNGLIEGRPRRSDPLVELQNGELPPESLFSIQFTQPLFLATAARVLGLSASSVFIILSPLLAFLSTLVLFLLLSILTAEERLAGVGAVFILCFGTLAGWGGKALPVLHLGITFAGFPFLRRYQPGLSFPLFFIFVLLIWWSLTRKDRLGTLAAYGAGIVFALLVFSYFFLWTAAAGWFLIAISLWLVTYRSEWRWLLKRFAPFAVISGFALAFYALLLAQIADTTSKVQILEFTRIPELARASEIIGLTAVLLLWLAIRRHKAMWSEPLTLITLSLAVLPILLLNQQVITGRSLQPLHFEMFIGNYVSLLALALAFYILKRRSGQIFSVRTALLIGLISIGWGFVEVNYDTRRRREHNLKRDEFVAVTRHLRQENANNGGTNDRDVVFSPDTYVVSDNLAVYAPQALLWATHTPVMPTLFERNENDRFFLQLYYSGVSPDELAKRLHAGSRTEIGALFGYARHIPLLTTDFKPLTADEIEDQVSRYASFISNIDSSKALHPTLSWAVIPADSDTDLTNLDRWYFRESEQTIEGYQLIRLRPRHQ